eukprot:1190780-Prorocentrum_minimum.AAC.1
MDQSDAGRAGIFSRRTNRRRGESIYLPQVVLLHDVLEHIGLARHPYEELVQHRPEALWVTQAAFRAEVEGHVHEGRGPPHPPLPRPHDSVVRHAPQPIGKAAGGHVEHVFKSELASPPRERRPVHLVVRAQGQLREEANRTGRNENMPCDEPITTREEGTRICCGKRRDCYCSRWTFDASRRIQRVP